MTIELRMPALSPTMTEGTIVRWLKAEGDNVRPGDVLADIETDKITVAFEAIDGGVLERILAVDGDVVKVDAPIALLGDSRGAARRRISPAARRAARESNVETAGVTGTGPQGRIVMADIARAAASPVPPDTTRKTAARRLQQAKRDIPHFYATIEVNVDAMLALRSAMNEKITREHGAEAKLSINDFVLKAAASTLAAVPALNASYADETIVVHESIDLSVAVALPNGLIAPVIRAADRKDIAVISAEMRDLALRARTGTLRLDEVQGGTFSISNLGSYGVTSFAAIINPPQAAILAVGASEPRAIVKSGAVTIASMLSCTLSVDHRVADGAVAGEWLAQFKRLLEAPFNLII